MKISFSIDTRDGHLNKYFRSIIGEINNQLSIIVDIHNKNRNVRGYGMHVHIHVQTSTSGYTGGHVPVKQGSHRKEGQTTKYMDVCVLVLHL